METVDGRHRCDLVGLVKGELGHQLVLAVGQVSAIQELEQNYTETCR